MMKTIVAKIETRKIDKKIIDKAVEIMNGGGVIIYPTETCYGIGCDATNPKATNKIYTIKMRDKNKPLPIIVSSVIMISKYAIITPQMKHLVKKFMPGPLTIVARTKGSSLGKTIGKSVSFRITSNNIALSLVKKLKLPMISTSANISGEAPLYRIDNVIKKFNKKVDMIIDAGKLKKNRPSTCIDMSESEIKIIREGPIPTKKVYRELGVCSINS